MFSYIYMLHIIFRSSFSSCALMTMQIFPNVEVWKPIFWDLFVLINHCSEVVRHSHCTSEFFFLSHPPKPGCEWKYCSVVLWIASFLRNMVDRYFWPAEYISFSYVSLRKVKYILLICTTFKESDRINIIYSMT